MFIQRLVIQNFRNLNHIELDTVPGFNLICGANGAGKTSVLEAINYLALGRSFRQASSQYLIQQGQPQLSIYAQIQEAQSDHALLTSIGMSRSRGEELMIKVNSDPLLRLIDLIDHICVQVIHPQGIELITKESEGRRSFIDWGVYYSDATFKRLWLDYRKALKQRNALLRKTTTRYKSRKRYLSSFSEFSPASETSQQTTEFFSSASQPQSELPEQAAPSSLVAPQQSMPTEPPPISPASLQPNSMLEEVSAGSSSNAPDFSYISMESMGGPVQGLPWSEMHKSDIESMGMVPQGGMAQGGMPSFNYNMQELSPVLQEHLRFEAQAQMADFNQGIVAQNMAAPNAEVMFNEQNSDDAGGMIQAGGKGAVMTKGSELHMRGVDLEQGQSFSLDGQAQQSIDFGAVAAESSFDAYQSFASSQLGALSGQADTTQKVGNIAAPAFQLGLKGLWSSPLSEFEIWNEQIADLSEKITEQRLNYLKNLQVVLQEILDQFLPNFKLKFELYFGWDKGGDLREQLAQNLEKERGLGYTLYGCHRADLKIKNHNLAAGATLSRGQLKMLVYAMRLAQGMLLKQQTKRSCIYLIDDLNSELDDNSQRSLLNTLLECQHQVFISNIQSDFRNILIPHVRSDIKVFSLDQGRLIG